MSAEDLAVAAAESARLLPAAPLIAAVEQAARRRGVTVWAYARQHALVLAYYRAADTGWVTERAGDVLATRLAGVHPCLVWPEWWGR